jgi:hypothetical protein
MSRLRIDGIARTRAFRVLWVDVTRQIARRNRL